MNSHQCAVLFAMLLLLVTIPGAGGYRESPPLGSAQSTHQFLFDRAVAILASDGHENLASWIEGSFLEEMKRGTIRADRTLADSREHYHDPWSHTGLAGFRSAADLAREQYALALALWSSGDRLGAAFHLGWAAHLVQDLTVPHHARLTPLDYHTEYEGFVLANQAAATASSGGVYAFDARLPGHYVDESSPWDWVDYNAHHSYDRFADVSSGDTDGFRRAMLELLPLAQRTTAGFLLSFFRAVNLPPEVVIVGPAFAYSGASFSLFARIEEDIAASDTVWTVDGQVAAHGRDVGLSFASAGNYRVEVIVTDALGVSARASRVLEITAPPSLTLGIRGPTAVERGTTAAFEVEGESTSPIVRYDWFADDVWLGSQPRLVMGFDEAGVVRIEVHVQTAGGEAAGYVHPVLVEDHTPPRVDLPERVRVHTGESVSVEAGRYVSGEDVTLIQWYLDGETRDGVAVAVRFEQESTHTLTLLAYDGAGNMAADTSLIVVERSSTTLVAAVPPEVALFALAVGAAVLVALVGRRSRKREK